jgi:hypothetical protein
LIGNKADLEKSRLVTFEEGEKIKEKLQISYFEETSAKTGQNTLKVISSLNIRFLRKLGKFYINNISNIRKVF